jgi:hypothetical protein
MLQWLRLTLAIIVLTMAKPLPCYSETRYMQRGLFLSATSFGSLAWIDNATSRDTAKRRLFVHDLSSSTCHTLPTQAQYWFLINHRGIKAEKPVSYVAVRAVARSNPPSRRPHGLILYRNAGWTTASGDALGELSGKNPTAVNEFVKLHDDAAGGGKNLDQRLTELNARLGTSFHALPAGGRPSSWEHRELFSLPSDVDQDQPLYYWASLTRFPTTSSDPPLIFYLNRMEANTITIAIDSYDFDFPLQETEIRIGRPCD